MPLYSADNKARRRENKHGAFYDLFRCAGVHYFTREYVVEQSSLKVFFYLKETFSNRHTVYMQV
jgi:hypothetical protein